MYLTEFTDYELKIVAEEIYERIINILEIKKESQISKVMNNMMGIDLEGDDSLTFNYSITIVFNDIIQIVGRKRRKGILNKLNSRIARSSRAMTNLIKSFLCISASLRGNKWK